MTTTLPPPSFGEILPNGATVITATISHVLARTQTGQFVVWSYDRHSRACASGHYFGDDLASAVLHLEQPYTPYTPPALAATNRERGAK